jgi:NAD(P)-dependent dehydrogenase (short-subunit alcohol dehydrogenase family)
VAIVVGAGQTPGDTVGNGRAVAVLFARHGARVLAVDLDPEAARETARLIEAEGGECTPRQADATSTADCQSFTEECLERWGRIDVLHNNVGVGSGDAGPTSIDEQTWDRILGVNLKSVLMPCRHVVPVMRSQTSGSIINVSSVAAVAATGIAAYKTSKAGVNALTHTLAMGNAKHGIRVNALMPGLMNTPMAIESISKGRRIDKRALAAARDAIVPLRGGMGTAWDVAYAALFLASDESRFVTGVCLAVDGGQSARVG